ncbi:MAG: spore maturation protein [Clostridiales bacterium]|nr:spore maturation protein [Clostridiales bacterium]
MMAAISAYILPAVVILIVLYGFVAKIKVYDTFVEGARDGLYIVADILPTLAGLMLAVGVLRASSAFELLGNALAPLLERLHMAVEVFTLIIIKMFSSSASTGLLLDIYKNYGTDSYNGLVASLVLSSTETIFYTMSVYFMAAKVAKTRYTLKGALLATAAGTAASMVLAAIM